MKTKKNGKAPQVEFDTSEFDREFIIDEFRPLNPDERSRWKKIQKKLLQTRKVTVRVEPSLLTRLDTLAKRTGVPRDRLVARGIKAILVAAGEA
jgi:predicted DNA binding CopG/RHH family protein